MNHQPLEAYGSWRYPEERMPSSAGRCAAEIQILKGMYEFRDHALFPQCSRQPGYGPGKGFCKQHAKIIFCEQHADQDILNEVSK